LGHDLITHLHRLRCCAVKQGQNNIIIIWFERGGKTGRKQSRGCTRGENQLLFTYPIC
jgi:hypothetical protein